MKYFSFKSGCFVWNENGDIYHQLQPKKTKIRLVYITAKDVLAILHWSTLVLKVGMGGQAFKGDWFMVLH